MIETEENKEQEEDLSCLIFFSFQSPKINNGKIQSSFLKLCARECVCVRTRVTLPLSLCCAALFRDSKQTLFKKVQTKE